MFERSPAVPTDDRGDRDRSLGQVVGTGRADNALPNNFLTYATGIIDELLFRLAVFYQGDAVCLCPEWILLPASFDDRSMSPDFRTHDGQTVLATIHPMEPLVSCRVAQGRQRWI